MWAKVESGSVTEIYTRPKALILGDVQYPSNIFELWTTAELNALNIYEVVQDNTNFKDTTYYANTAVSYAFQSSVTINSTNYTNVVVASYGTATALTLSNLKTAHKSRINSQAAGRLSPTDWMTIRETEGGTAMPSATKTWRASVRTKANSMCTQIDGAANVDALGALWAYTDDGDCNFTRPLGEFPELS